jgi:DNA-binding transcriptional regulator YiaG
MATKKTLTPEDLTALLETRGLSSSVVAKKLGVTWQAVSNWKRGLRMPSRRMILKLEELLSVRVDPHAFMDGSLKFLPK